MKKINLSPAYLELLANSDITAHAFKVLMLLLSGEAKTSAQIADTLHMQRQNTSRYIAELTDKGLVTVDRIEGRNKFIRAVMSTREIKELTKSDMLEGQTSML